MARKFGVEIECTNITPSVALRTLIAAGINCHDNTNYGHGGYNKWRVTTDGSVSSATGGCEVVSPILEGEAGIAEMQRAAHALCSAGATVNKTCGLHVHVNASDMSGQWIRNIVTRYSAFETEIDSFMPASRRRSVNQFCQGMSSALTYMQQNSYRWNNSSASEFCNGGLSRYYKVNLCSYARYQTIEFRQHSGSVNGGKIANWVRFLLQFVEASKPNTESVSVAPVARRRGRPTRAAVAARNAAALNGCSTVSAPATVMTAAQYENNINNNHWRLNRNQRKIYAFMRRNEGQYVSIEAIRADFIWNTISEAAVKSYISVIRSTLGVTIKNSRTFGYKLLSYQQTVDLGIASRNAARRAAPVTSAPVVTTTPDNLWRGISATIQSYYTERAMELSSGSC